MVYAAIDIHKRVFQTAVLDAKTGELVQERLPATREGSPTGRRAGQESSRRSRSRRRPAGVGSGASCRRAVSRCGCAIRVRLGRCAVRSGGRRPTVSMPPGSAGSWPRRCSRPVGFPPGDLQYLRDRTRLRRALSQDRMRFAQRLHALLTHEGWPCSRGGLLSVSRQRWARSLALPPM
jgi:hypothetical protein